MRSIYRFCVAFIACTLLCNMEFTVPKKKGGPTAAQLSADIGGLLKDSMCQLFDMHDDVTAGERVIVEAMESLMEQSKDSFFGRASRDQLQAFKQELEQNLDELVCLQQKIRVYTQRVQLAVQSKKKG